MPRRGERLSKALERSKELSAARRFFLARCLGLSSRVRGCGPAVGGAGGGHSPRSGVSTLLLPAGSRPAGHPWPASAANAHPRHHQPLEVTFAVLGQQQAGELKQRLALEGWEAKRFSSGRCGGFAPLFSGGTGGGFAEEGGHGWPPGRDSAGRTRRAEYRPQRTHPTARRKTAARQSSVSVAGSAEPVLAGQSERAVHQAWHQA